VSSTVSPLSVRSTPTVQRASSVDQSALTTRWWKRILRSMPYMLAVSFTYLRIAGPSAIAFASGHGRKRKPSVYMSESERMPG
jgi:hypothetical protein